MADVPETLTLVRHRDRTERREIFGRRAGIGLLTLFLLAGAVNLFGQRPQSSRATVGAASLKVYAPKRVRGGLYFEARFTIDAHEDLEKATLVLDSGWLEGITINTIEPSPVGEASRDGKLALELGHIPARETYLLFLQLQVNPTNVGHRDQNVALYDGDTRLVTVNRTVTIFP
jgi:hypothetical protein